MADPGLSSTSGPAEVPALDYRSAFEFAPVAVALSRDRRIVDCNLRMLAMFGAQRDDLVGTPSSGCIRRAAISTAPAGASCTSSIRPATASIRTSA